MALGAQVQASSVTADNPDAEFYGLGFRYPQSGDVVIIGNHANFGSTRHFLGNYEVTDEFFDNIDSTKDRTTYGYFGFSDWIWFSNETFWVDVEDTKTREMFRFIG